IRVRCASGVAAPRSHPLLSARPVLRPRVHTSPARHPIRARTQGWSDMRRLVASAVSVSVVAEVGVAIIPHDEKAAKGGEDAIVQLTGAKTATGASAGKTSTDTSTTTTTSTSGAALRPVWGVLDGVGGWS